MTNILIQCPNPPLANTPISSRSWTLKVCTPHNPSAYFCNFVQQSGELFTNFLTRVTEAVEHWVDPGPTWEVLNKQLT